MGVNLGVVQYKEKFFNPTYRGMSQPIRYSTHDFTQDKDLLELKRLVKGRRDLGENIELLMPNKEHSNESQEKLGVWFSPKLIEDLLNGQIKQTQLEKIFVKGYVGLNTTKSGIALIGHKQGEWYQEISTMERRHLEDHFDTSEHILRQDLEQVRMTHIRKRPLTGVKWTNNIYFYENPKR